MHLKKIFEAFFHTTNEGVSRLARERDPNRDKALELFKEHGGNITNRAIAEKLGVLEKTISAWKNRDKWNESLKGVECSTTKNKKVKSNIRTEQKEHVINSLVEAGTYSPALDLLIEIYLDAYEVYVQLKENGVHDEKNRRELARLLGQLGLDGKNKDLIKKSGRLLAKEEEEKKEKPKEEPTENSKLVAFRQRMNR